MEILALVLTQWKYHLWCWPGGNITADTNSWKYHLGAHFVEISHLVLTWGNITFGAHSVIITPWCSLNNYNTLVLTQWKYHLWCQLIGNITFGAHSVEISPLMLTQWKYHIWCSFVEIAHLVFTRGNITFSAHSWKYHLLCSISGNIIFGAHSLKYHLWC